LNRIIEIREKNFNKQNKFFSKYSEIFSIPEQTKNTKTGWLAYPILINRNSNFKRKDFQIYLEKRDIQTRVVFTGNVIRQPMMRSVNYKVNKGGYPNADSVMERGVLLPLHHGMTDEMFDRLHNEIDNFINQL
jgi:CDP-6-deoxy-D-xylo-4-hexulose-3-dehydrase